MINAVIIDDESHCLVTLSLLLREYCPEINVVDQCNSALKGIYAINKYKPDLVFLDIEMPAMNGFEMLEHFGAIHFAVIFTTSYDQYAIKAIRFSALDYLLKPVDPRELELAVKKVRLQQLPLEEQFQMLLKQVQTKGFQFNKFAVPTLEGYELIPAEQVIFFEANDNYTHIFLKNKSKVIASKILKDVEEQMADFSFFMRVHHSYMVNMNEVIKYVRGEGGYLVMSDGNTVNVSRSRKDSLLKWF